MTKLAEIKSTALSLFARHGYEGTTLAEIAKEVGIKPPSMYAHFESKEALFLTVFSEVIHEHAEHADRLLAQIGEFDLEEKLQRILLGVCRYYLSSDDKIAFLKRSMLYPPPALTGRLQESFYAAEEKMSAVLRGLFREGIASGRIREMSVDDLVAAYYTLLDGTFLQVFYYGPDEMDRRLENVWKIFWTGISTKEA